MYYVKLTINGNQLYCTRGNGIDILTISGLTGTSARLNTVQSNLYLGEDYTNGTVGGITLDVKGVILDGNTVRKQALLDTVVPLGEGSLAIYKLDTQLSRWVAYRTIDVVVKSTPVISQEKHSKFSFSLYAPKPIWKAASAEAIALTGGTASEVTIEGQTNADYSVNISVVTGYLKDLTISFGSMPNPSVNADKYLYCDFRKYNADGVASGTAIEISRVKGKLILTIGGVKHNECIYAQSTLDSLTVGTHGFYISSDATITARITYYPSYVGVLVDGV